MGIGAILLALYCGLSLLATLVIYAVCVAAKRGDHLAAKFRGQMGDEIESAELDFYTELSSSKSSFLDYLN